MIIIIIINDDRAIISLVMTLFDGFCLADQKWLNSMATSFIMYLDITCFPGVEVIHLLSSQEQKNQHSEQLSEPQTKIDNNVTDKMSFTTLSALTNLN